VDEKKSEKQQSGFFKIVINVVKWRKIIERFVFIIYIYSWLTEGRKLSPVGRIRRIRHVDKTTLDIVVKLPRGVSQLLARQSIANQWGPSQPQAQLSPGQSTVVSFKHFFSLQFFISMQTKSEFCICLCAEMENSKLNILAGLLQGRKLGGFAPLCRRGVLSVFQSTFLCEPKSFMYLSCSVAPEGERLR
jgi:hypothetical protein